VRIAPSWPLTLDRCYFEYLCLVEQSKYAPEYIPEVYFFDRDMSLYVMEYLTPHIILRRGIIKAIKYPLLDEHVSDFLAKTLFHTSDLYLKSEEKKQKISEFPHNDLLHLTEKVIYTEPYIQHPNNRNNPEIQSVVDTIQSDIEIKLHVSYFKDQFMNNTQALIHGDLHTGSIMVTQERTFFIDPEFAMYGPMSFDVGKYLGNLILGYLCQDGQKTQDTEPIDRDEYKKWLKEQILNTWYKFYAKFINLWNSHHSGDLYDFLKGDEKGLKMAQELFMNKLFHDSVGIMGLVIIRRILGIAHVQDIESIKDLKERAKCETVALNLAVKLIKERENFSTIDEVVSLFT